MREKNTLKMLYALNRKKNVLIRRIFLEKKKQTTKFV